MSSCLLLIVHGSRDPKWREPFEKLEALYQAEHGADKVFLTYMELNTPTLMDVVARETQHGTTAFKVLPLFMASGGHVDRDIPKQIHAIRDAYPDVSIEQLSPVGMDPLVVQAMSDIVAREL